MSLAKFTKPPTGHRLWVDARDVEFLKDDLKDRTEILQQQATTIRTLVDSGYSPDAVIDAVDGADAARQACAQGLSVLSVSPAPWHLRLRDETPMCNLYLSMMDRMGVKTANFGDSTGKLDAIG